MSLDHPADKSAAKCNGQLLICNIGAEATSKLLVDCGKSVELY